MISGQTSLVGSNAVNGAWCLPTTGGDARYGNGQILRFGWAQNYYTDLHTGPNEIGSSSGLQFRQVVAGQVSALGWRTLLDTANYAGILDSRYLLKSAYTASDILAKLKTVDGSGSGIDADLLDGLHASNFYTNGYTMFQRVVDASGLDQNTWYPVTFSIGSHYNVRIECRVSLNSGTKPSWSTHSSGFSVRKIWEVNGSGWETNPVNRRILVSDYQYASSDPVRGIGQNINSSIEYVYVRGGGKYYFYVSHNVDATLRTSSYTSNGVTISVLTSAPAAISRNVAYVTDNVASATKLATARLLWGQSFNGTGNVSGDMTGVGRINNALILSQFGVSADNSDTTRFLINGHRLEFGGPGYAHQSYYFRPQYTANGATYADMFIQNASAAASPVFTTTHYFDHNGNAYHSGHVGIGMAPTGNRLDVAGTIHSTTGIWSDGYVSAKGQDTTSDARYKKDIAALPAQAALAVLMRLRPSTWAWRDDGHRGAGFVAQEVTGVLPEAVREVGNGEDRHLALNYQMLHAYEVSALQTHETELERLRGRVNQLENEIKRIRHES